MVTPHDNTENLPGLSGVSKDQMAKMSEVKKVTSALTGEIISDFKEGTITIKLMGDDPKIRPVKDNLLELFPQQLATQLDIFFGIKGKIIKRNRNAPKP